MKLLNNKFKESKQQLISKLFNSKLFNNKMISHRAGYSVGFTWIFGLVTLFGLGILYIVFTQIFTAHLVPVIKTQVNSTAIDLATQITINYNIDKYMDFFNLMPFILGFVVILYMVIAAVRKEGETGGF